jgi:hypothetical protein
MNFSILRLALLIGGLFFLIVCGGQTSDVGSNNIALEQNEQRFAGRDLLIEIAKEFYKSHPDEYDMLVLWSAPEFGPGNSFYLPIKNDVSGIGYENEGSEFFDNSPDFGSQRLQGIIWMGPDWITNSDSGLGPRSVLGILAQETGHRWAAMAQFRDPDLNADSSALLEDAYHWNFYLNTGSSPMGGNRWEPLGDSLYKALPVDNVEFSQLDLYLMGLLAAEDMDPLELLVNTRSRNDLVDSNFSKVYSRTTQPIAVQADLLEVSIEQIIDAEGERDPDIGFNAKNIRQAWIYVYRNENFSSYSRIVELEELRKQWDGFFSDATGGRSTMNTSLH